MTLPFFIVDVFAEEKFRGNQLAVFPDSSGLSKDLMQEIAREMHFSETTFVDPVDQGSREYMVRIFTPGREVPFAGHPVLGTAFIIRNEIIRHPVDGVILAVPAGRIPVTFSGSRNDQILMRQNQPVFSRRFDPVELAPVLSLPEDAIDCRFPVEEVSTGLPFIIVPLISRDALRSARINRDAYDSLIARTEAKAVYIFSSDPNLPQNTLVARMFGDYYGVPEDPATGSAAGCLAGYLARNRYFSPLPGEIRIEQGHEVQRPSLLICRVRVDGENTIVEVGGSVILVARGDLLYP